MVNSLIRSAVVTLIAGASCLLTAGLAAAEPNTTLSHDQAIAEFRAAGFTWSSSGKCSNRNNPKCTSFEQIRVETVEGAKALKRASGCALNITGGTETGHAGNVYSHSNGYKLDFSLSQCLGNHVRKTSTYIGGNHWRSPSGNVYYLEPNHWDVTFFNCGC